MCCRFAGIFVYIRMLHTRLIGMSKKGSQEGWPLDEKGAVIKQFVVHDLGVREKVVLGLDPEVRDFLRKSGVPLL